MDKGLVEVCELKPVTVLFQPYCTVQSVRNKTAFILTRFSYLDRSRRPFCRRGGFRGRKSYSVKRKDAAPSQFTNKRPTYVPASTPSQSESIGSDFIGTLFSNDKAQPIVPFDKTCRFPGWLLYYPRRAFKASGKAALYTQYFMEFIGDTLKQAGYDPFVTTLLSQPETTSGAGTSVDWFRVEAQGAVLIDYHSLIHSRLLNQRIPELKQILGEEKEGGALSAEQCETILQSLGLALHTLCYNAVYKVEAKTDLFKVDQDTSVTDQRIPSYIAGRIINHFPVIQLQKLRAHHLGRFISVKGIVVRVGHIDPVCRLLTFECIQCRSKQLMVLPPDGRYSSPSRCLTRGCRSRCFEPLLNHPDTVTVDTQLITIQEASEQDADHIQSESGASTSSLGRSPRCLNCRLTMDLADSCIPGDVVHLAGVVTLLNTDGISSSSAGPSSIWPSRHCANMFSLLLDVNSLYKVSGIHTGASLRRSAGMLSGNSELLVVTSTDDSQQSPGFDKGEKIAGQISSSDSDFSIKDLYAIREISEQPNLFRLLVASLCPGICGRGLIKAGLLLALFGGTQTRSRKRRVRKPRATPSPDLTDSVTDDRSDSEHDHAHSSYRIGADNSAVEVPRVTNVPDDSSSEATSDAGTDEDAASLSDSNGEFGPTRRAASHVLIVGDPGLGKSQMLRAAASLAPRVIYVCGNTATAAGLTVSTIREGAGKGSGGNFGLEAGALVLADQGCCCIDEFDKLVCDPAVLLEAMEQQTISVARGGLVANLPARAAVLAAANPVGGHYDSTRRLEENLRIAPALLSRFDLIFVLLDRPDEVADRLLSEHVTAVHTGAWKPNSFICTQTTPSGSASSTNVRASTVELDPTAPLAERLELRLGEQVDYIPSVLLRKYILYSRKYVMPSLSTEAAVILRDFYLELRRNRHLRDTFPVTLRQLESLVRLTEARARAELREEATKEDALDACELMRATGVGTGHVGGTPANATLSQIAKMVPLTSTRPLVSNTGPAAAKRLLSALELAAQKTNSRLFTRTELQALVSGLNFSSSCLDALLTRLNDEGALLKQGPSLYKLI
ncbi:hypothetical protein P879_00639 [Paragonimus westermani]|uniref:Minichromosome maintenance 8 n=1 Tax=Paragonimus westermani TaxID=34504 RepID=A0A8T0DVT9_9TREM|nr:hypothetical protein P879_00639 [Paragonimus westermani]